MIEVLNDSELFQSIFESSKEGILVMDEQRIILEANPVSENMFGYAAKKLIGKSVVSLIPMMFKKNHAIYKKYLKDIKTLSKDGEAGLLLGLKQDRSEFPIKISLRQSRIKNKDIVIAFVTAINETNDTLYKNNKRYNKLINNLPGFVYSSKNNRNREMMSISKRCFSITGYTPNEFKEHKIYYGQIILKEDRDDVWSGIQKAISIKKPYNLEYHIRKKDGCIINVWEQGEGVYDKNGKLEALEGFITEITEQKKIEQELRANEVRNKAILQAIPDFIFVLNKQGVYLDLHTPDPSKLILPKDELIGKSIYDVLPKEVCKRILLNLERCEKTEKPQTMEYSLSIRDKLKYFEARIVAKENGNFLTIIRDVTDNKHNAMLIKESEERFRLAMLATHDGFYDFDPKSKAGWYNQTYIDLFGPTDEKNWWENNIHPSDKKNVLEALNKILADKGNHWKYEYRLKRNDGLYVHIEDHGYIVRNNHGKAIRMLGAVVDITEQKKAEQTLRNYSTELKGEVGQRTHELEVIVQQLVKSNLTLKDQVQITKVAESKALDSQIMLTAIAKYFPKGIIIVVNSNFEIEYIEGEELEKMGLKDLTFPGTNIDEINIFSKIRQIRLKQDIQKTLGGKHLSFEVAFKNSTYLVNSTPLFDEDNKVKQALLVYSNISVQKEVELDILNALRREQELNELKSRFISMASHEFRTPLSAILSSATLIEKQNEPGMEEKRKNYTGKIKSNVRNLVVILNDFLSLSKLEEGKISIQPEYFDMINFSKSLIQEIETNKKEGQVIKITNDYPSIEVNLDPKMIRHILSNLISNAIKYSPKYKEINLFIRRSNERIFLEVKDEGIGIPVEEHNNLFDRFFRARNASNIQGTGLGLYIVKQYAQLIGGAISFKSKLSKGSTFIVELPINQNENEKSTIN